MVTRPATPPTARYGLCPPGLSNRLLPRIRLWGSLGFGREDGLPGKVAVAVAVGSGRTLRRGEDVGDDGIGPACHLAPSSQAADKLRLLGAIGSEVMSALMPTMAR